MSRKGISAVAVTVFGVTALLIGLLIFSTLTLALVRGVNSGGEMARYKAEEYKAVIRVVVELVQERSGESLLNKTYIVLENTWPGDITIDHVALVSKTGQKILDRTLNIMIKAGGSVKLAPSQIDQTLKVYDEDFWKFKREVDYIEIHTDFGEVGASSKSYPIYSISGGGNLEIFITTVALSGSIVANIETATTTTTMTATPITMITETATSTKTSTYITTLTTTITTTCIYTTCKQQSYATGYTTVKVTVLTTIIVYKTSPAYIKGCYISRCLLA